MISMRVSVDQSDPGFQFYRTLLLCGNRVRVLLDGVEIPGVVTADEDKGEVLAQKFTPQGKAVYQDDCFVYERKRGRVLIVVDGSDETRTLH